MMGVHPGGTGPQVGGAQQRPYSRMPPPSSQQSAGFHPKNRPISGMAMGGSGQQSGTGNPGVDPNDPNRRKSVMRKTVDYNCSFLAGLERRIWQRDYRDRRAVQADVMYYPEVLPPPLMSENSANAITTKFVKTATNKMRCPVFTLAWTPEGRRLITGASSGEFTLWNGLTFNFETILQAHDVPVRTMKWSHDDTWMVTGDHGGYIKYWQSNMNNVKMFQAHKESVRDVSFSPTDTKFASCSDDGSVRIWDFFSCYEERVLLGHGADVRTVDWHPTKGLIASGSKDTQQPVKLWEPKSGRDLQTIHAHKNTVMDVRWNRNGNWLLTASRDHLLKLFDIRNLKEELQTFRGHKREAVSIAWHPVHEGLFASGGSDGSIMFWSVGCEKEVGAIESAHDNIVWKLDWHPVGHILCSGSNDHTCKFWTRNRPGDTMRDKYNLNTLPYGQEEDVSSGDKDNSSSVMPAIPGMAPEDRVQTADKRPAVGIPGLDPAADYDAERPKKVPFSKPIPKNFVNSWNHESAAGSSNQQPERFANDQPQQQLQQQQQPDVEDPNCISLQELQRQATAVVAFGNVYPVLPGSNLFMSILSGEMAVKDVLRTEFLT